ncbi:Hsp20/alpha crystallin family protein [Roseateles depolymerans]|uniref:Heat shock protein Hsp20 n=1 Tax=Roseateles depolymerans TaxID=76731 RepID=A0A0U3N9U3_9BURK|nr:Hsp20/alpha crystallin family protein [Roseateles depolymerans]ALV05312.1 Heat shock protein Hsp20 [Roseateles depolymerans]REG14672.1 HSP20 family protein [Roseateles depolymerans]
MYQRLFARDLFNDLERLQREVSQAFDVSSSIRGQGRGGYPALNVGLSPEAVEVYAFAPGLDPASISVDLDRGVLSLSGERASQTAAKPENAGASGASVAASDARSIVHQNERFSGSFRRVVSLPDDIDPDQVQARYRDGVLRVTIKRRAAVQPRRIDIH